MCNWILDCTLYLCIALAEFFLYFLQVFLFIIIIMHCFCPPHHFVEANRTPTMLFSHGQIQMFSLFSLSLRSSVSALGWCALSECQRMYQCTPTVCIPSFSLNALVHIQEHKLYCAENCKWTVGCEDTTEILLAEHPEKIKDSERDSWEIMLRSKLLHVVFEPSFGPPHFCWPYIYYWKFFKSEKISCFIPANTLWLIYCILLL